MDEERYLGLLAKLIGEAEHLQNNPAQVRMGSVDVCGGYCVWGTFGGALGIFRRTHPMHHCHNHHTTAGGTTINRAWYPRRTRRRST